ncbi:MAG: hypothetical protein LBQ52_08060 [Helicobacteraceae bacterium]|jgi:hemolysin activation/secretion protein|nr:hypothetical protein [Helicobacteraceae bacterium]
MKKTALFTLFAFCAIGAIAAPNTDIGASLRNLEDTRPKPDLQDRARAQELPAIETLDINASQSQESADTILINEIKIEDAPKDIDQSALKAITDAYINRRLTLGEIEEIASKITALCREARYALSRAYLPRQDTRNGVLTIKILNARYGVITIDNSSLARDFMVKGSASGLQSGDLIKSDALERAMLLIGDLYGATMPKANVAAGSGAGTSDLTLDVGKSERAGGYVFADNYGSRYTGKTRMGAGLDVNSPLGIADRISLSAMRTSESLINGAGYYSLPLGTDGLRLTAGYSDINYDLGAEYLDLNATGRAKSFSADLTYPLIRSRLSNLYLNLNLAQRELRDEIGAFDETSRKKTRVGVLGAKYERWSDDLYSAIDASFTFGRLKMRDEEDRSINRAGANTLDDFYHINLGLSANYALSENFSLSAITRAQYALNRKNLDSGEQFSVTGSNAVKAYRETIGGDHGWYLGAELRYNLPSSAKTRHSLGIFADTAYWRYADGDYALKSSDWLHDVGIGYYVSVGDALNVKLQVARAIGDYPAELTADKTLAIGQITIAF